MDRGGVAATALSTGISGACGTKPQGQERASPTRKRGAATPPGSLDLDRGQSFKIARCRGRCPVRKHYQTPFNRTLTLWSVLSKMALEALFGKKYKLASSDKFDEYMKALGKRVSPQSGKTVWETLNYPLCVVLDFDSPVIGQTD